MLDYCAEDVYALERLLPRMLPRIDLPRALLRGRYGWAVASMEHRGIPIDVPMFEHLRARWQEIQAVWAAGADVVAIDATERPRPDGQRLEELVARAAAELGAPLMADVDSVANGLRAAELGCAWVGTTLFGYTEATARFKPPAWDLLGPLRAQLPSETLLICEGGLASAEQANRARIAGADAVVVGTAITGVDLQVAAYARAMAATTAG